MRTSVPPMSLACAPKICSTRTRTVDLVRLLPLACAVTGLPTARQCIAKQCHERGEGRVADVVASDQLVPAVHVDVVLVAVVAAPVLLRPARIRVLLAALGRLVRPAVAQPSGSSPDLIASFSLRVLRFFGTATMDASRICPPRAMVP